MPTAQNHSILLIDDEVANLRLLIEVLRVYRLEVITALHPETGLDLARRLLPDLILLDVLMPRMDGLTLCRQLKAGPGTRDIPVIFLSARRDTPAKIEGLAAGAVDYIGKPFDPREVLLRVLNHIRLVKPDADMPPALGSAPPPGMPLAAPASDDDLAQYQGAAEPSMPLAEPDSDRNTRILLRARDLLDASLTADPDLGSLARAAGSNRTTLVRLFRSYLGLSPFEYLRELRLSRAYRLLATTDQGLQQIADAVGYRNARDLSTAFKARYGFTPRELRRRVAAQPRRQP